MDKNNGQGIIGGALSLTLSAVIVKLLGLIYKIPLSNMLGDEGMGYFNSAYTVYAFFYLLCTAGVPKAIMILVSEAKARGSKIEEQNIVRIATRAFLALGTIATAIFILFAAPLADLIGNSSSRATMIAIAPSIIFISLAGVIRGCLNANMQLLDIAVSQIIEGVGKLVLGLIFATIAVRRNLPLEIVSALTILGVTFGSLFGLLYLSIRYKKVKIEEKHEQKFENGCNVLKRIFGISLPITLGATVMSMTNIIDLSVIMRSLLSLGYTEQEASALYGNYTTLAVPMFNLAIAVITPISAAFMPTFTRAKFEEDRELMSNSLSSAIGLTSFLSAPLFIGMTVFSREILTVLFPASKIEIGATLLILIAPAIFFSSLLLIINSALEAVGEVKAPIISMLCGAVVKTIVSQILLCRSDFGISGAPIGTVASYAVALCVSGIIYISKCDARLPMIKCSLPSYFLAFFAVIFSRICYDTFFSGLSDLLSLALAIVFAALVYAIFSVFFGGLRSETLKKTAKYTKIA